MKYETHKEGPVGLRKFHETKHVEALESAYQDQLYLKHPGTKLYITSHKSAHRGHALFYAGGPHPDANVFP
jgi:hypothetical protein